MGLPIWRDSNNNEAKSRSQPDLTPQHALSRSSIRRRPSIHRSHHRVQTSHLNHANRPRPSFRLSPPAPPPPPNDPIPPVPRPPPGLLRRNQLRDQNAELVANSSSESLNRQLEDSTSDNISLSAERSYLRPDTVPAHQNGALSPTSGSLGREENSSNFATSDDLPPLRRVGSRSINDRWRSSGLRHSPQNPQVYPNTVSHSNGLGDRDRSWSPEVDQWETMLTTITPDPSLPSAGSSFASNVPPIGNRHDRLPSSGWSTRSSRHSRFQSSLGDGYSQSTPSHESGSSTQQPRRDHGLSLAGRIAQADNIPSIPSVSFEEHDVRARRGHTARSTARSRDRVRSRSPARTFQARTPGNAGSSRNRSPLGSSRRNQDETIESTAMLVQDVRNLMVDFKTAVDGMTDQYSRVCSRFCLGLATRDEVNEVTNEFGTITRSMQTFLEARDRYEVASHDDPERHDLRTPESLDVPTDRAGHD